MGHEFEVLCDCFELSFEGVELVELSIIALNLFSSEESVSGVLGGGFAFVAISVAPLTPIS
jgi:hypothetical protein